MRVLAGRYELVRFVGRGGMGEVWEGRDRVIERRVAVKLLPHDRGDQAGTALFFREARTAGALHHPGVVTVHDLGRDEADGSLFLVMEFLEGRDLAALLRADGVPSVAVAVDWAAQAAVALARAHQAGIVHRDLKPANLMLTGDGVVKILDFGIARFVEGTNQSSKIMGTLAYMPPERFDEQPGDARSDLYSFGCVLHELLTGNAPFDVSGPIAMMNAHLTGTPTRPGEHRPGIPTALDDLVLELLSKDPDDRPPSADDVHQRLRAFTPDRPTTQLPPTRPDERLPAARTTEPNPAAPPPVPRTHNADATTATRPAAPRRDPAPATPAPDPRPTSAAPRGSTGPAGDAHGTPSPGRRRFLWLGAGAATALTAGGITAALGLTDRTSRRKWSYTTDGTVYAVSVAGGIVYAGSGDRSVYALDATTGTKKWSYPTTGQIGALTVVNGAVYAGSWDDSVYCLDALTGDLRWSYGAGPGDGTGSWSLSVVDGVLYASSEGAYVHAVDAATGTKKWSYDVGGFSGVESSSVVDGVVYVGKANEQVHALDAATGTKKWSFDTAPGSGGGSGGSTLYAFSVVGTTAYAGNGDRSVKALDAATGAKKWSFAADNVVHALSVAGEVVYAGGGDSVYALDAATGAKKWSYTARGSVSSLSVVDGVVYVGSHDRSVYALDAVTGVKKWSYATGGNSSYRNAGVYALSAAGGVVYAGGVDTKVYALSAE